MSTSTSTKPMREQVEEYINNLQDQIVLAFEKLDPNAPPFKRDSWVRAQGGTGCSCVFAAPPNDGAVSQHESVLEKAGINISIVHGRLPPSAIRQMRADHNSMPLPDRPDGLPFFAAGISLVVHPRNPHAPTVHANYRYFEITEPESPDADDVTDEKEKSPQEVLAWWFGGGSDLTPSYLYEEDAVHFHSTLQRACDQHGPQLYPTFKKWCDEYFYIPHRQETRGIGGLFFDDLNSGTHVRLPATLPNSDVLVKRPSTPEDIFTFVRALGDAFVPSYLPILSIRHNLPYTPHQRRWQLIRRGRYVEFNLVYDRGTKFGLMTPGARIESILMSLPETARWEYMSELGEEGTEEGRLMAVLREPREWV
ncbi:coproporphyrinogen III oxidase [Crucibulum laeve]|uniref:coproporphyrinogen oxidase n=1 Tax=Crucibulum laeve TaxID=68775 RepID=A0A5C3M564_9AGAR|nr:coproporphyrinogen III oxidase [Crucibulum laeve]